MPIAQENYSYYQSSLAQMAGQMAGMGPAYMPYGGGMMSPGRDYMHSSSQHFGRSAWSAPGGLNTGNQLLDIGGAIAMQMALGKETFDNMRPMGRTGVADLDYIRSRARMTDMQALGAGGTSLEQRIYNQNLPYLSPRSGLAAGSSLIQRGFDAAFNPGGSQMAAFQTLHTGLGNRMGGGDAGRTSGAERALEQMNQHFMARSGYDKGGLDFKETYGFNRVEMAEQVDAGSRYGIGGMSQGKFARAVNEGTAGKLMKDNAKVFSAAQGVFGKDKSMEELSQLMTKTVEGFQGLDANKATDLLHKIQATSRAVGISSEAFSEYSQMLNQVYKSVGAGGSSVSGHIMNSAMGASAATEVGRRTGDAQLGNMTQNMDAMGRNTLDAVNSPALRRAQAFGSIYANLSEAQRAGVRVAGVGSMTEIRGQIQKAIDSGDGGRLVSLLDAFDKNVNDNDIVGKNSASNRARNLSDRDRDESAKFISMSNAGAMNAEALKKGMAKQLGLGLDAGLVSKAGGEKGLYSLIDKLGSFGAISSREQVLDALNNSKAGLNLSDAERERMASQFAYQARGMTNNENWQRTYGFQSSGDANAAVASSSRAGRDQRAKDTRSASSDVIQQKLMAGISGDALREFKLTEEGAKLILGVMGDMESGKLTKNLVTDNDGNLDLTKLNEYTKGKFGDVFKNNTFAALKKVIGQTGDTDALEEQVNKAYNDEFAQSGDKDKAQGAADQVIQGRVKEINDRLNQESEKASGAGGVKAGAEAATDAAVGTGTGGDPSSLVKLVTDFFTPMVQGVADMAAGIKTLVENSKPPLMGPPPPPPSAKKKGP